MLRSREGCRWGEGWLRLHAGAATLQQGSTFSPWVGEAVTMGDDGMSSLAQLSRAWGPHIHTPPAALRGGGRVAAAT